MPQEPPHFDVLILGAGAAGLVAGRSLATAGLRTAILEARDRIGGRIFTVHENAHDMGDVAVELGAEFVHGLPSSSWNLIREARLDTRELFGSQLCFTDSKLQQCRHEDVRNYEVLEDMTGWLSRQPVGTDVTFAQYLDLSGIAPRIAERAASYVEGFNAADRYAVGVAALARQQRAENAVEGDRLFHINDGYEALPRFLCREFTAQGGSALLDHEVTLIEWQTGRIKASGRRATGQPFSFTAQKLLTTLPLGVLQEATVEFRPRPAEFMRQVSRMRMGSAMRVSLLFKSKFWSVPSVLELNSAISKELRSLSFMFARGTHWPTWWTAAPSETPLITGWMAGPKTETLKGASPVSLALQDLARIFDLPQAAISAELASAHFHDWDADAHSRGAYSYVPAGGADAPHAMSRPLEGTLFFAGEHTDTEGHWGTVHAALNSGVRAAAQVLETS